MPVHKMVRKIETLLSKLPGDQNTEINFKFDIESIIKLGDFRFQESLKTWYLIVNKLEKAT